DGAIEYITEKLPFDRYTGRIFNKAKGEVAKEFAEAVSSKNSPVRSELEKLLVAANERLGGKLFTKRNLKDYIADIIAEGASEFSAEALQTMTSMMYEERENYPTLNEIVGNGFQGALAGIFMGSVLGGASKTMEHVQNRNRRKEQGYVDVALVNFENGDSDVVEIVDADGENAVVLKDGEPVAVSLNNIGRAYRYTFEEFEAARMRQLEDEALDEGNVSDGMLEASTIRVGNAKARLDEALSSSGLPEEVKQQVIASIETGERIPVAEDIADAYSEYFDEVNRDRELQASREAANQREREAIVQEVEQKTGAPFWREEMNNEGLEPTRVVETGTLEDGTQVYILSDANENGQYAAVTADGKKMFVSAEMMPEGTQSSTLDDYASAIAQARREKAEASRISEEKVLRENEVKPLARPGVQINLGTQESPVLGTITQTTPDGVIVQTDAGVSQITWEEAANAFNVGMPSMTDAEIARAEAADIVDTEAQWRGKQAQTEQEAVSLELERDAAIQQTKKAMPLPLKADGSVDQTALWNKDPERWAEWNDEQRQDGGANSLAYINGAITKESARIAEMQAGYDAISDFDERDAVEREVAAIRDRLQRLVNL
ncbi:MAG: hypothetical protein IIV12_04280, partial [Bacteroidales bacterium]|nr:hypothetical protein [Bacteroidales bacterium]